ncbi:hypothetical protein LP090_11375 [Moraxella bovis]|uniref:hypothetical protein n=1 Tax=Moraxella bovis TaxID=476 RepID=UPI00222731E8|nr:hypothetical protein [Moraxella bovis]UYZ68837.1 hypothetical protein LP122_01610 [Moraxella bovis]UYZ71213.1 hypothetical protein LP089_01655 [Moraxella bovis]UYZ72872.1 hypothetical protein LP105_10995 [Moraxella bovis]UZA14507.1 hypothetical protein LP102_01605 [Moraxella bovis]UZA24282.1 hypothetical protein LP117_11015 [Moraxella bovis]
MNTIELIHKSSCDLTESERLEVFGYINMIKARLGRKNSVAQTIILPTELDNSDQAINILERIAQRRAMAGISIDIDEFEKSRQDRELDR